MCAPSAHPESPREVLLIPVDEVALRVYCCPERRSKRVPLVMASVPGTDQSVPGPKEAIASKYNTF